ncbi:MAG: hypothetical protein LBU77_03255, partial [Clostridiales bacterium]|nr:hypothetical protein [Clostridiales bacterium]
MYTNTMRMTGLSGLDTDTMVKQLMQAESVKLVNLRKSRQANVWRQEQYQTVIKQMQTYQDSFLSFGKAANLKSASSFRNMTSSVKLSGTDTTSNAISVKTSETSTSGDFKLKVEQIATKDIYRGRSAGASIRGTKPPDFAAVREGDTFNVSLDGQKAVSISFTAEEAGRANASADAFVDELNKKL